MVKLNKIAGFLNEYLKTSDFDDSSWNGLQIEGRENVEKIVFAVDAGAETFERAAAAGADLVIVHHGLFWKNSDPSIADWNKKRIDPLYNNKISLYASHLPLDAHNEVGNNAEILKMLGAKATDEFSRHGGQFIGKIGEMNEHSTIKEIEKKLQDQLGAKCISLSFGTEKIRKIAVCSGAPGYAGFFEALNKDVDLYITGDASEVYMAAKDAGFNAIFAGHHATETAGLKALSAVVEKKFNTENIFIDIPTGL